jgi:hypothetical protein
MNPTELLAAIKAQCPSLRRTPPVAITPSGGTKTILSCIFCGEQHSVATRNRDTAKHVKTFWEYHNSANCLNGGK